MRRRTRIPTAAAPRIPNTDRPTMATHNAGDASPVTWTASPTASWLVLRGVGSGWMAARVSGEAVTRGVGVGRTAAVGLGVGDGGRGVGVAAGAADFFGIGWIETYRPSQIIGFGSYFQGVK